MYFAKFADLCKWEKGREEITAVFCNKTLKDNYSWLHQMSWSHFKLNLFNPELRSFPKMRSFLKNISYFTYHQHHPSNCVSQKPESFLTLASAWALSIPSVISLINKSCSDWWHRTADWWGGVMAEMQEFCSRTAGDRRSCRAGGLGEENTIGKIWNLKWDFILWLFAFAIL